MKIEVELSEIESLRDQIKSLERQLEHGKELRAECDPLELKRKAIRYSKSLFNEYMKRTFKEIGFVDSGDNFSRRVVDFSGFWTGDDDWYMVDELKMELSAHFTNKVKRAFLEIIKVPELESTKDPLTL